MVKNSFVRVHVLNSFSDFLFGNYFVSAQSKNILAVLHDRLRLRKSCLFRHVFMNWRALVMVFGQVDFFSLNQQFFVNT